MKQQPRVRTAVAAPSTWPLTSMRGLVLFAGAVAAASLAVGLVVTWRLVGSAAFAGSPDPLLWLFVLGSGSFGLRFLRWHLLATRVAPRLRPPASWRIYLAGFALGLTPGRVGELCKFTLLREETGVPEACSTPIFPIERATEAASFAGLALVGAALGHLQLGRLGAGAIGAIVAIPGLALLGLVLRRRGSAGGGRRWLRHMAVGVESATNPPWLAGALLCAAIARCCDTALFWRAATWTGASIPLAGAALAFGLAGLAGGLLLLPGGVGAVEGSLVATSTALGADPSAALVAAVLARSLTLWVWIPPGLWLAFRAAARPELARRWLTTR